MKLCHRWSITKLADHRRFSTKQAIDRLRIHPRLFPRSKARRARIIARRQLPVVLPVAPTIRQAFPQERPLQRERQIHRRACKQSPLWGRTKLKPSLRAERYILTVRQQPRAARACGFGERDRRVIDPPPIVQLSLKDYDPTSSTDIEELRFPFNIVHCALLSAGPQDPQSLTSAPSTPSASSADVTAVPDPAQSNRISRRLMGTLVASPFVGTDPEMPTSSVENASLATFFIFQDLSCRQNGRYKLRFTLMKVPLGPNLVEGGQGRVVGSVESDEFDVFSAKDFPGMRPSTLLTRDLKRQGAGVSVKKGKGFLGAGSDKRADTVSGSDDDAESETRPRKKRT